MPTGATRSTHDPAVTTAARATTSRSTFSQRATTPSSRSDTVAGPTPNCTSAPCAAARSCSARTVSSERHLPASGWKSTARSNAICGQRSRAASGLSRSLVAPHDASAASTCSIMPTSPWSSPPVVSRRGNPASSSSSRHSGSAALRQRDVVGLGVREAEDARPAVAAAARVALLELLEEHDVDATPREPPRGRRAHRARSDHDDVTPHQSTSVADLSRRASTASTRTAVSAHTRPDVPITAARAIDVRASVPAVRKWTVASPQSGKAST